MLHQVDSFGNEIYSLRLADLSLTVKVCVIMTTNHLGLEQNPGDKNEEEQMIKLDDSGYENIEMTPTAAKHHRPNDYIYYNSNLKQKKILKPSKAFPVKCGELTIALDKNQPRELTDKSCHFLHSPTHQIEISNIETEYNKNDSDGRATWSKKADFLLSIIGFAVDLANIWRFPYLCYKNGGGAFLIPYLLMLIFGALPLFYLELAVGQYNRQGPITLWNICPMFKGIGYCAVLVSFYTSFYYNCIIGWAIHFLIVSVSPVLPWTKCNNTWNTQNCHEIVSSVDSINISSNITHNQINSSFYLNRSIELHSETSRTFKSSYADGTNVSSPAEEYFYRDVLGLGDSHHFGHIGQPIWQLALCMFAVYAILYFVLIRGVKSSGKFSATSHGKGIIDGIGGRAKYLVRHKVMSKSSTPLIIQNSQDFANAANQLMEKTTVVWITATMPYVVLAILFVRGTLLPGALDGLKYYVSPDLNKLKDPMVWVDAAVQIFYSVGVGFGVHITYASYNKFDNNCYRDCLITSAINSFTSFFSGMVIFTYLGFMSQRHKVPISKVATEGHGLVFQVYPEAIATLTGSQFWSVLFFLMLIMLGFDSSMGGLECVVTSIMDEYKPFLKRFKYSREIFTGIIFVISYTVALPNVTQVCSHTIAQDIQRMIKHKPSLYWRICWKYVSPAFLLAIIIIGVVNGGQLSYNNYKYPPYAIALGWVLTCSSVGMIPAYAIFYFVWHGKGSMKQVRALKELRTVMEKVTESYGNISNIDMLAYNIIEAPGQAIKRGPMPNNNKK
ncbi:Sodium-dependent noradrenaline transporter [Nymphon striatum]|nr:Sodium-dependent noradrenaline transporter [Nymphon striatum]